MRITRTKSWLRRNWIIEDNQGPLSAWTRGQNSSLAMRILLRIRTSVTAIARNGDLMIARLNLSNVPIIAIRRTSHSRHS